MAASEEKTGDADKESSERSRDNFGNSSKGSSKPTIHDCSSEVIQHELLVVVAKQLLENEHSRCRILLRDDKMGDLSRMYMLFNPIPQGLEYVADLFKQAASTGGAQEHVLIRKLIKLHDKYMVYVTHCFQNHTLFHKALKEAFDIFCNKAVAGSSSAELLATFCDNILKKGGSEKLSDEAIEERLENVDPFSPSF